MAETLCPYLQQAIGGVAEYVLSGFDFNRCHRECEGRYCHVDVLGTRLPVDKDFPDRTSIKIEVDGFQSCTYKPEESTTTSGAGNLPVPA